MATATGTGAPIVTGAAGSVVAAGSGVLGLAFIAALAL